MAKRTPNSVVEETRQEIREVAQRLTELYYELWKVVDEGKADKVEEIVSVMEDATARALAMNDWSFGTRLPAAVVLAGMQWAEVYRAVLKFEVVCSKPIDVRDDQFVFELRMFSLSVAQFRLAVMGM